MSKFWPLQSGAKLYGSFPHLKASVVISDDFKHQPQSHVHFYSLRKAWVHIQHLLKGIDGSAKYKQHMGMRGRYKFYLEKYFGTALQVKL